MTFCKLNIKVEYPINVLFGIKKKKEKKNDASKKSIELVEWDFFFLIKNIHLKVVLGGWGCERGPPRVFTAFSFF